MQNKTHNGHILLLFDIDGTLLKVTSNHHFEAFQIAIERRFPIKPQRGSLAIAGMLDRHIIGEILKNGGICLDFGSPVIDRILEDVAREYAIRAEKATPEIRLMPGIVELLEELSKTDVSCGLLTGNIESIAWQKIRFSGLESYFESFGGFGDAKVKSRGQLVPIAAERALTAIGRRFSPERIILVGDTPKDIEAAREAGAKVIAVGGTYDTEELKSHNPDLLLESFHQKEEFFRFLEQVGKN